MQFRKLYIKNFQSIKEMEIEFKPNRVYHIKGINNENNIGKSSFIKAIKTLVSNISSRRVKKYIRDGEESFFIESTDFEGNVIRLSRGKEDYYEWLLVDGNKGRVDGTGGKVPDEVREYFNFYEDMEKTKEILNIRPARSKLLFVDTTFGENYYLFQKALGILEFLSAIKLAGKKKKDIKKNVDLLELNLADEKEKLNELKDYTPLLNDLKLYEDRADDLYNEIELINETITRNNNIENKEKKLNDLSFDFDEAKAFSLVEEIKLLNEVKELMNLIESKETSMSNKMEIVESFEEVDDLMNDLNSILDEKKLIDSYIELENSLDNKQTRLSKLNLILEEFDEERVEELRGQIGTIDSIVTEGKDLRVRLSELKDIKDIYDKSVEEEKEFMEENKFCPLCGSNYSKSDVHVHS